MPSSWRQRPRVECPGAATYHKHRPALPLGLPGASSSTLMHLVESFPAAHAPVGSALQPQLSTLYEASTASHSRLVTKGFAEESDRGGVRGSTWRNPSNTRLCFPFGSSALPNALEWDPDHGV
jgi:hypothetical protein